MTAGPGWLARYAGATWTPPFPQVLPSNAQAFAAAASPWKAARRRALRELNLAWHGQGRLLQQRLDTARHRRVLWIHQGTPQVGDSLMDLAARVLLKDRVGRLDLLTDAHLLPLYRSDAVFSNVASSARELPDDGYDLVLLHSMASRSVRDKLRHFRHVPFVHVQGCYTGPEFNRTLFGFYRLAQLMGLPGAVLEAVARPTMRPSESEHIAVAALAIPPGAIAVALGGVRDWRTYTRWIEVLRGLAATGRVPHIVLIGADNGLAMRDAIVAAEIGLPLIDRVGRHSLGEVQALIDRCALALCADGGLLHVAHTTGTPVVALFAGEILPAYRVTSANRTTSLHGPRQVDDIDPEAVLAAALSCLNAAPR
jgi:heptosyltransferase-2